MTDTDTAIAVDRFVAEIRAVLATAGEDPARIARELAPKAAAMAADRSWLRPDFYAVDPGQGFGIVVLHEEPRDGFLVETVCWAPGRGVAPHDHRTWGVVAGLDGRETNLDWRRLDDGAVPGRAALEPAAETVMRPGDVKTFVPTDIHSMRNDSDEVSLSLHVYGRHLGRVDRFEFNPVAGTVAPCPKRVRRPA
jgi:predicted metal-dependent enzyme (double-stranded beta helix superfamily)